MVRMSSRERGHSGASSSGATLVLAAGPALSFLFFHNANSHSDQEGLLLGEVVQHVTDAISDTHMSSQTTRTLINVHAAVPCAQSLLASCDDAVQLDELWRMQRDSLKEQVGEVVGWFRFRRASQATPSLQENVLHRALCRILPRPAADNFVFFLLASSAAPNSATHAVDYGFFRLDRFRKMEPVPLSIKNLGDTSHSEYKMSASSSGMGSVQQILNSFNAGSSGAEEEGVGRGVEEVSSLRTVLQMQLLSVAEQLEASESRLEALQEELRQLRQAHQSTSAAPPAADTRHLPSPSGSEKRLEEHLLPELLEMLPLQGKGQEVPMEQDEGPKQTDPFEFVAEEMRQMGAGDGVEGGGCKGGAHRRGGGRPRGRPRGRGARRQPT